ncbi:hypothetical protein GYMLUDRAFT_164029, partial [Collybiopsis luxurians FD-317 M1]
MPRVDAGTSIIYERLRYPGIPHRSEVANILHDIDKDSEDYAYQISSLESQLAFLRSQRERLQHRRTTLSSLLSPIHYLPNEILLKIFLLACCENDLGIETPPALGISAVCFRWRELADSCADLWSSFSL